MTEQGEIGRRLNEYIEGLQKRVKELHTTAADYDLQIEYWVKQRELFEKYGAKIPIAMQNAQFMIEQIAAASVPPTKNPPVIGISRVIRPRVRSMNPRENRDDQTRNYNIAPQVKPIMNGVFGRGKEDVPQDLDSLFDEMYGRDWHSRTIDVPTRPGLTPVTRTYLEDLHSGESYIRRLIKGADKVINRNMRGNIPPTFPFRGRVAAVELIQLYNKIDAIGWDVYDDFMFRNRIR